jgi:hypothetical protein
MKSHLFCHLEITLLFFFWAAFSKKVVLGRFLGGFGWEGLKSGFSYLI